MSKQANTSADRAFEDFGTLMIHAAHAVALAKDRSDARALESLARAVEIARSVQADAARSVANLEPECEGAERTARIAWGAIDRAADAIFRHTGVNPDRR